MEEQDQLINQEETEQPEKKRRGRPARIIQSGVTVIDTPNASAIIAESSTPIQTLELKVKKKRGRKPKISENDLKKFGEANSESHKANKEFARQLLAVSGKTKKIKRGRKKTVRNKKRLNVFGIINASIKQFKMPKIKIDLSGIKLPKGLTWGQVGAWTIAAGSLIVAAAK